MLVFLTRPQFQLRIILRNSKQAQYAKLMGYRIKRSA